MLTTEAFNALLKTLEEPPPHIIFILATTDAHKVPATIVSRCQRHDFQRIPLTAMVDRLAYIAGARGHHDRREGLELIARSATGSLRDAINLLEQICDSYGKEASLEAVREGLGLVADERAALAGDAGAARRLRRSVWRRSAPCATTGSTCGSSRRKSSCGCASCCSCRPAPRPSAAGRRNRSPR